MPQCEIVHEEEVPGGWRYDVRIRDAGGAPQRRRMTLSWSDYNLWSSSGTDEPAAVALAVIAFLASRAPIAELRDRFDASLARRLHDDADRVIPGMIGT